MIRVKLPGASSPKPPTASILVTVTEESWVGKEVSLKQESTVITSATFSDTLTAILKVEVAGDYIVSVTDDGSDYTSEVTVSEDDVTNEAEINVTIEKLKIVTFAEGSDEEISAMLDAHYAGKIDIADYWSVGDSRIMALSAMAATGVRESHDAQSVSLVIIGIKHDDLSDGSGKAAITVQQKNCLNILGYMNSSASKITDARWSLSERRTWCNNVYYNAIPEVIRNMTKLVNKVSIYATDNGIGKISAEITEDKCFLVSNWEIFGSNFSPYITQSDGVQYDYYKTSSNRIKKRNGSNADWSSRSAFFSGYPAYMYITTNGEQNANYSYSNYGIAPAFCL